MCGGNFGTLVIIPMCQSDGAMCVSHSQKEDNTWEQDAFNMKSSFTSAADLIYKNSQCCIF